MRLARLIAVVASVGLAGAAHGQEVVKVEQRPSTAGIVLRDTIAGGLLGSAVSGGIILYKMGIQDESHYDWGRTLAWGAVIGVGAGLVWGLVDVASGPTYAMAPHATVRDGLSMTLDIREKDQSGRELFPVLTRRF